MSNENYLKKLFIDEAKPALQRHSGGGGVSEAEYAQLKTHYITILNKDEVVITKDYFEYVDEIVDEAFSYYNNLLGVEIPEWITRIGRYAFRAATRLISVEIPDSVTHISRGVFNMASKLQTVKIYRSANSTDNDYGYLFNACANLQELIFTNIAVSLQVGSGNDWGHLLTVDSLVHLIYELRDTGSSKTLTVGSANLEKLANVYVKTVEITDEMRAEDDLVDEKLPFVVCESTDEGAMLIVDYAALKNWDIA